MLFSKDSAWWQQFTERMNRCIKVIGEDHECEEVEEQKSNSPFSDWGQKCRAHDQDAYHKSKQGDRHVHADSLEGADKSLIFSRQFIFVFVK